jgi:hypothetical protein
MSGSRKIPNESINFISYQFIFYKAYVLPWKHRHHCMNLEKNPCTNVAVHNEHTHTHTMHLIFVLLYNIYEADVKHCGVIDFQLIIGHG